MRGSILIVSMLILVLLAAPMAAMKQAAAKSTPSKISTQAEKGNDDTLYLKTHTVPAYGNLTTEAPTGDAANIIIKGRSSVTRRWVNETEVPEGQQWIICGGDYSFAFWISRNHKNINVTVTFKFGYIDAEGRSVGIVTGAMTNIEPPVNNITEYNIIVNHGDAVHIYSRSRLFVEVNITVGGPPGQSATFYYDGVNQKTRIITPLISQISAEQVSEFPFGAVFLPPALLSAYFILKRRIVRFRA